MKTDPRRYAPIGLILSGLAFLTILGILVIRVFTTVGMYTPPDPDLVDRILYIAIAVFIAGYAIFAILDPDRVRKFLTGRQAQYGSNSLILFVAFVGILIAVNMLADRYPQRWDVTEDKQHTLASETIEALEALPEPVTATAFYSIRMNSQSAEELLQDFKASSNGKFDYRFLDPDANPVLVKDLGITGDGKILLQMGENKEIVSFASENELTGGLIRLLNPSRPVIYFLTGEGEHDTENPGDAAYTRIRQVLESKNYAVKTINLQAVSAVPEDADAIVVAGPLVPLSESVVNNLKEYLANKGSLLVLANPVPLTEFGEKTDLLAEYLASDWGVQLNNDIVVDTNSSSSPFFAVAAQYGPHPITEKMQNVAAIFPYSRSLTIAQNANATADPLVYTIQNSWGETDFSSIENNDLRYDDGADQPGPMLLAAAAENITTGSRVVVFGSSSFAQDSNFDFSGNGDMLVNSIDWLALQDANIGITQNESTLRTFNPPGSTQVILLVVTTTCLIPLAVIVGGVYAWVARRKRG
ncbi:MAG: GldG family protein [Chloroflexota bacterium]